MDRIYHTWEKWECYPAGFYESRPRGELDPALCEQYYAEFLRDTVAFQQALLRVVAEWPRSCEHYLSNPNMNRIAWLGQASVCLVKGIPSSFCGGFNLLTEEEQIRANKTALMTLNQWLIAHGDPPLALEQAASKTKANLY